MLGDRAPPSGSDGGMNPGGGLYLEGWRSLGPLALLSTDPRTVSAPSIRSALLTAAVTAHNT